MVDKADARIAGDADIDVDGVRLMVTWTEQGEQQSAFYWVARGEMLQLGDEAGVAGAANASSEHLFRLLEKEVRQCVLDKHAAALRPH